MTSSFRFLEDIALADSAFEARGDSPSELFTAAATAVIETLADPRTVSPALTKVVTRHAPGVDTLLFDWLADIVYLKDAEGMVFHDASCLVSRDQPNGEWHLEGTLTGATIDPARQELRADIKAITKHRYEVRQNGDRWVATVVMDI